MAQNLEDKCTITIPGNKKPAPAEYFAQMASWCEAHNIQHDVYGDGELIQSFEQKVADLLGFEAGLFVITGTMTQATVLELICKQKNNPLVGMHESSHITRFERQGYQLQDRFNVVPLGNRYRPWTCDDLKAWPDELAAVLYELPMRELGGQLPTWEELTSIKQHCKQEEIYLHMDGARVWETEAYYQKDLSEIADGFDSAYVSLYKGINGLGGSLLLGSKALIELASMWMKRQGGNVYHRSPYVVSAAMQFDQRLQQMPKLFERTQQVYEVIKDYPQLTLNPTQPQSNMLHLIFPVSCERLEELRVRLAEEKGVYIGRPQMMEHPSMSKIEWYVGDNLLSLSDSQLREVLNWLIEKMNNA
ncbi:beta-eliminating lyase-related protein [Vibrio sp. S4M6]|uniref:threonine aldolase family protein n=1 Tax=Vibrio sinus TaxID=2946865 RepID=UPI00202A20C4|nr:beta-eliminating lyase-related protein [Vibrio sinus]MCL9780739.1 beta-eliminating lyase-related protein [Vibrio sinus]